MSSRSARKRKTASKATGARRGGVGEMGPEIAVAKDDGEYIVSDGIMVSLRVPTDLAASLAIPAADGIAVVPPAEMHLTLAVVDGTADQVDDRAEHTLAGVVARFATDETAISGRISGSAIFVNDEDVSQCCAVALVEADGLDWANRRIRDDLYEAGAQVKDHDTFLPHITLAYGPVELLAGLTPPDPVDVTFDTIGLTVGGQTEEFTMYGPRWQTEALLRPVVKSAAQRYIMAPLYVPESDDHHGEHVTGDDLQKAAWDQFRSGDRIITLQHSGVEFGELVGSITWPTEYTTTLTKADGTTTEVTLPAGTVYQEVICSEEGWNLVEKGLVNGFSLEGSAIKVSVEA